MNTASPMTLFYADDGCYWITTQEALNLSARLPVWRFSPSYLHDVSPDAWYYTFVGDGSGEGLLRGTGRYLALSPA